LLKAIISCVPPRGAPECHSGFLNKATVPADWLATLHRARSMSGSFVC
jgi:hypothetical protein